MSAPQNSENRRVLVVDDNESIHHDYRKILCQGESTERAEELDATEAVLFGRKKSASGVPRLNCEVDSAFQGEEGVSMVSAAAAAGRPYSVAFVDMRMPPGIDGLETIERIWKVDPRVQVVICSAYSDHTPEQIVGRLGLTDKLLFLRKPFDSAEVSLIGCSLMRKWDAARSGELRMAELVGLAEERTSKLSQEIAERRAAEDQMRHMALHDSLTGLHNREYLMDRLRLSLERLKRDGRPFALLFLDLDNFKLINDSLGHDVGDALLVSTAQRLTSAVRELDLVVPADASAGGPERETTARLGGDEFVVLLEGIGQSGDAAAVADRVQKAVSQPFVRAGRSVVVSVSIGVTVVSRPSARPEDILRDADMAMYRAKGSGKARYAIFDEQLHDEAMKRLALETDLRRALEEQQFELVYEPIVEVESARVTGFEALIRWRHPTRGVIGPADFIPIAEETGMIVPLGRWVTRAACRQIARWTEDFPERSDLSVSVNISKRQLIEPGLIDEVRSAMQEFGVRSPRLILEITESSIMQDLGKADAVLRQIKQLGIPIHLDDFGTGLSSLSCLHQLPIDVLKIDRSFIMNMTGSIQFAALVHAVLTLAKNLRIKVIAEGVQSNEQLAQLIDLECDYLQGFHLSRTLSSDEASKILGQDVRWRTAA